MIKRLLPVFAIALVSAPAFAQTVDYKVLATSKTSTMEKEMNEFGAAGYKFMAVMGGETAIGGGSLARIDPTRLE